MNCTENIDAGQSVDESVMFYLGSQGIRRETCRAQPLYDFNKKSMFLFGFMIYALHGSDMSVLFDYLIMGLSNSTLINW